MQLQVQYISITQQFEWKANKYLKNIGTHVVIISK